MKEFLTGGAQHRMNDLLQLLDRGRVMHHLRRETRAIYLAISGRARKRRFDGRHRLAFV
jgi:hypothetical protein